MDKKYKNSVSWDSIITKHLQDEELAKDYLNDSLMEYIEDSDFKMFFKSLERVVKARSSVREFAKQAEMDRTNLHALFNDEKNPQNRTVLKVLTKLGYTFKVA